jgi:flagellin-specific chaperone FliS
MSFKKDVSKVKSFSAGPIKKTGAYVGTITRAYDRKSQNTESVALHIDLVMDNGESAAIDLWYLNKEGGSVDKNGKELSAIGQINELMVLLEIEELKVSQGMVSIYDYDAKTDVEVKKRVYKDLVGQSIGAVFEVKSAHKNVQINGQWQPDPSGATKNVHEFKQFFSPENQSSAAEFLSGTEPVEIDRYLAILLDDSRIIKQASNQPNSPQNAQPKDPVGMNGAAAAPGVTNYDDFDEDIPF